MLIDANRVKSLITNEEEPETKGEELLVLAYQTGIEGTLLKDLVMSIEDDYDNASLDEIILLITGYMVGQAEYFNTTNNTLNAYNKH